MNCLEQRKERGPGVSSGETLQWWLVSLEPNQLQTGFMEIVRRTDGLTVAKRWAPLPSAWNVSLGLGQATVQ